jgi:hypothetical protein
MAQISRFGAHAGQGLRKLANPMVVRVALECPDGGHWLAVAGGETLEKALESAVKSAPSQKKWRVAGWNAYAV